jgi:hypothetical protein
MLPLVAGVTAPSAQRANRGRRTFQHTTSTSAAPTLECVLLVVALLLLAPSSLFPSPSDLLLREAATRSAATPSALGPFLAGTVVTRWNVLFADAYSCPYSSPGTTGCSATGAPIPGCNPVAVCLSPQQVTECVIWCGMNGIAPYGGAPCKYVQSSRCQTCNPDGSISHPMFCTRKNTPCAIWRMGVEHKTAGAELFGACPFLTCCYFLLLVFLAQLLV